MKRNLLIIVVGLVVFVVVYAFFFPESQLPIHISTRVVWEKAGIQNTSVGWSYFTTDIGIFEAESIDSKVMVTFLGFPKTPELPQDLTWGSPQLTEYGIGKIKGIAQVLRLKLVNGYTIWDGEWSYEENYEKTNTKIEDSSLKREKLSEYSVHIDDKYYEYFKSSESNVDNDLHPLIKGFIQSIRSDEVSIFDDLDYVSNVNRLKDNQSTGKEKIEPPFGKKPGARGCRIGDYDFVPTENGRIERIKDKIVTTVLDRSNMGLQAVPSKLTTDGKDVIVLLDSISEVFTPSFWVQIYGKRLEWKGDLVEARGDIKPVSITYYSGMILTLWQDGVLTGHSIEGYEMFHKKICDNPLDILATNDCVYLLTKIQLLGVNITQQETKLQVWPRIADLGAVHGKKSFSITVKCDDLPGISVKGQGLNLVSVTKDGDYAKIKLEVKTIGLPAFRQMSREVIIDSEGYHDVVPVLFTPFGKVRRFQVLSDSSIDTDTGEIFPIKIDGDSLKIKGIDDAGGELLWNKLTSETILLSPKPGGLLP